MITKKEFYFAEMYIRLATSLCVIKGEWSKKEKLLKQATSYYKIIGNFLAVLLAWFFITLSCWRLERVFHSKTQHFELIFQILHILVTLMYIGVVSIFTTFFAWNKCLVTLWNQLVTFIYKSGFSQTKTNREKYLVWVQIVYSVVASMTVLLFGVVEAHYVWIVTSNVLFTFIMWILGMFILFEASIMYGNLQMFMFIYFTIIKTKLVSTEENTPDSIVDQDIVDEMVQEYKSLIIICTLFNQSFCRTIVPAVKYVLSFEAMICILIAIRLRNMDLQGTVVIQYGFYIFAWYFIIILTLAANMTSGLWQMSTEFISKFRVRLAFCETKVLKHYLKASLECLLPTRFEVGGIYYMEREAKLTFVNFLINGTANWLVAFGRE